MTDEMKTEGEPRRYTRRKLLSSAGAGLAVGIIGSAAGGILPFGGQKTSEVTTTSPSVKPSTKPTPDQTQTAKPTESPSPSPEVKVGELPDILSSTDKDWQKYFAKETDIAKKNEMVRKQQAEENAKAQAEGRQPNAISLFIFDPFEAKNWTIRKIMAGNPSAITYAFLLQEGTILRAPFEGAMNQRGFSNGGRSLDIIGKNGYLFWAEYFGNTNFNQRDVIAGEDFLTVTKETQLFKNFGNSDMKGDATIFGLARKDPTSPFSNIKWLTNDKGQIIY